MKRKTFMIITMALALALMLSAPATSVWAQALTGTPQTPLAGSAIPQFVDPLPTLDAAPGGTMETVTSTSQTLYMREFTANVLPSTFTPPGGWLTPATPGTYVFGYRTSNGALTPNPETYIGPVFVATRGTPTEVTYVNNLGIAGNVTGTSTTNVGVWKYSFDQTLHWANPNNLEMFVADPVTNVLMPNPARLSHYNGPIPAVPHLHGGEVPAAVDGSPDSWFLSEPMSGYTMTGPAYYSKDGLADKNYSIYRYPNTQESGPLWFHDHLLGGTRVNVYAGLAGAYLLFDPTQNLPSGMTPTGLDYDPANPNTNTSLTVPLVIQDRSFDTNGQLYFPDLGINPEHPFWIPEFVGDAIAVNGKTWPYLQVDPKRYRFMMINGSNARFYELSLMKNVPMYVIGTDGGYLDYPVQVSKLIIGPGERYQLIIDFGKYAGKTINMTNNGRTPFPKGTPPQGSTLGNIIQFRVNTTTAGFVDNSYNPALGGAIRTGNQAIVRLAGWNATTHLPTGVAAVTPDKTRLLTLNEVMGPGGPLEILVNNTKWGGMRFTSDGTAMEPISTAGGKTDLADDFLTELPAEGTTEMWEIVNLTADAHPIHLHLVQFQILNRQNFNVNNYTKAYNAAFPVGWDPVLGAATAGGVFIPAYGPPSDYFSTAKEGGNPDVTPYLQNGIRPPDANEAGWKDTAIMYPGQVTRILVRFTPTDNAVADTTGYPFEPNWGNYDYVWHCHIVDHEDNEMMRPYQVIQDGTTTRTYNQGSDY